MLILNRIKQHSLINVIANQVKPFNINPKGTILSLIVIAFIFLSTTGSLIAQPSDLLFPINPGSPNTLSGTMGELRSSHFHTGIDIRTGGHEGLPVLAADDGYIFRVSVNPVGYGNAIYIKHPNGHTTVYAHLKSFRPDIAAYVRKEQYQKKKFNLNVFPDGSTFKVKRGDFIALSGNSGSSGGPHLHFDVRNKNQDLLNPLHYGFSEITDTRPPVAKNLALVTTTIESRVNGEFGRVEIPFKFEEGSFFIKDTIQAFGIIGLELYAYDRMNNTRFKTGITKIEMSVNNSIHLITSIDTWPFAKARQFFTYVNYEELTKTSKPFHKLYIDDGNTLGFYSNTTNKGYLTIEKGKTYTVDIMLLDSYNNKSTIHFVILGSQKFKSVLKNTDIPVKNWQIDKNTLVLKAPINDTVTIYSKGEHLEVSPAFNYKQYQIYVWNLKRAVPDSISIQGDVQPIPIKSLIPAGVAYKFYSTLADIQFSKSSLFSNLYLTLTSKLDTTTGFEVVSIGNSSVPLNKNITVNFKPTIVPIGKKFWAVYSVWGKSSSYTGSIWNGNQISFKTRNFGSYTLLADSISPTIKPILLNQDEMVFKISDNLSGINKFTMLVNNTWVLMNYDPKRNIIWAEKPNAEFNFKGKLELTVTDNQRNTQVYSTNIK